MRKLALILLIAITTSCNYLTQKKASDTESIVSATTGDNEVIRELRKNYAKENLNLDLGKLEDKRNAMIENLKNQGYTDKDLKWGGDARNKSSEKYVPDYDLYQGYLNEIYKAATDSDTSKIIN